MLIILLIVSFTVAYQANKPCDDACFKDKMARESNTKTSNRDENDWRYNRNDRQ